MAKWPWERESVSNPWWPRTQYMVNWLFAHTCAANCPYCFVRQASVEQTADSRRWWNDEHRWWTDEQAINAWENLASDYGPGHIIFSGLEPSEQLPLISAVLKHHYGAMLTNLSFDVDEFTKLIPPDRCRLHPSFQPHLWGMKAEPFVQKLLALQKAGYFVLMATIVGYPPYLDQIAEWANTIRAAGFRTVVLPFLSADFKGKAYPAGYTEDEWTTIVGDVPSVQQRERKVAKHKLVACGAGHAAAYVMMDGLVRRCGQVYGMEGQNLMRDGTIKWLDEPKPCPVESCPCTQFHAYHIKDSN